MDVDPAAGSSDDLMPFELNLAAQGHGLDVSKDKLTVRYVGEGRHTCVLMYPPFLWADLDRITQTCRCRASSQHCLTS